MEGKSMFGSVLQEIMLMRQRARDRAIRDLWQRNKATSGTPGWRLDESARINRDGVEVVELRLYKLVDCSVVSVRASAESMVEKGLTSIEERRR